MTATDELRRALEQAEREREALLGTLISCSGSALNTPRGDRTVASVIADFLGDYRGLIEREGDLEDERDEARRERDEARAQVQYLTECEQMTHEALERVERERDEALNALVMASPSALNTPQGDRTLASVVEQFLGDYQGMVADNVGLTRERDEARARAEEWREE